MKQQDMHVNTPRTIIAIRSSLQTVRFRLLSYYLFFLSSFLTTTLIPVAPVETAQNCDERVRSLEAVAADPNCDFCETSLLLPRPQGLNSAVFFDPFWYQLDGTVPDCAWYFGYRFNQTFNSKRLAQCLFGTDVLTFTGSQHSTDLITALQADNFGLAPNFQGRIKFTPRIQNHQIDLAGTYSLGCLIPELECGYISWRATVAHTNWNLQACDHIETPTTTEFQTFPTCAVSSSSNDATRSFETALSGTFLFGNLTDQWQAGKFALKDAKTKTGLANIDLILGYDFLRCPYYHVGAFLKVVAPTGNRPDSEFIFQPIIGNGHHWELGGGLDGHVQLWCCNEQSVFFYAHGAVTHLFRDTQLRTFDFRATDRSPACLSRYILLKEFTKDKKYTGHLISGVNFTTRPISSEFSVQGDATARLLYRTECWAAGLGYNVYGRSKEKVQIHCSECCNPLQKRSFGIRGTTGTCARGLLNNQLTGNNPLLSATQSTYRGRVTPQAPVDNPVELVNPETNEEFITWNSPITGMVEIAQQSEKDGQLAPVLVTCNDSLSIRGIPSQLTHKAFLHIDYQWQDCYFEPSLGIGGEVEFAQSSKCHVCTPEQWGIWVHSSITF